MEAIPGSREDGVQGNKGFTSNSVRTSMEIGNTEGPKRSQNQTEQRERDIEWGACFTCHQVRCRPWKHRVLAVNNVDYKDTEKTIESDSSTESQNWRIHLKLTWSTLYVDLMWEYLGRTRHPSRTSLTSEVSCWKWTNILEARWLQQ